MKLAEKEAERVRVVADLREKVEALRNGDNDGGSYFLHDMLALLEELS